MHGKILSLEFVVTGAPSVALVGPPRALDGDTPYTMAFQVYATGLMIYGHVFLLGGVVERLDQLTTIFPDPRSAPAPPTRSP